MLLPSALSIERTGAGATCEPERSFGIQDLLSPTVRSDEMEWFERTKAALLAKIQPRNAIEKSLAGNILQDRLRIHRLDRLDRQVLGEDERGEGRLQTDDDIQAWLRYSNGARHAAETSARNFAALISSMQADRRLHSNERRHRL